MGIFKRASEPMSQKEAIKHFLPQIEKSGKDYKKFTKVKVRKAKDGEKVETFTADGKETENTAKSGDYVVTNIGGSHEQYLLSADKLAKRYEKISDTEYQAKGECRAMEYKGEDTDFVASWDEKMVLKKGDMICTPLPEKGEVYRIAKKEFESTYKEK